MGAFSGGLSFRQYYVTERMPDGWKDLFQTSIQRRAFRDIEMASEEERAVGWCSPLFALDVELDSSMWLYTDYIVLSMRIDTLSVPGPLLRIHAEAEARRMMTELGRPKLSRYERAEIKERVKVALRKRQLATIKTIDMAWNWMPEGGGPGVIRFFSSNEKVNQEFAELFEATFDRVLVPDCIYTATRDAMAMPELAEALLNIESDAFVDPDVAVAAMTEV